MRPFKIPFGAKPVTQDANPVPSKAVVSTSLLPIKRPEPEAKPVLEAKPTPEPEPDLEPLVTTTPKKKTKYPQFQDRVMNTLRSILNKPR